MVWRSKTRAWRGRSEDSNPSASRVLDHERLCRVWYLSNLRSRVAILTCDGNSPQKGVTRGSQSTDPLNDQAILHLR
jgi:hypothetical protein